MQEVWRVRLPRLGVVNSIGRKKFFFWGGVVDLCHQGLFNQNLYIC